MPRPFVVNPTLTAIAIAYQQAGLIADEILPYVPVGTETFKYTKYALSEGFTIPNNIVGRKSKTPQVEFTGTEATDLCVDYGLEDPIPYSDIDNAPVNYDPKGRAIEMLMQLNKTAREKRVADLVFNASNYATANKQTLSGTSQFSDYTNSDPIGLILAAMDTCIMRPTIAVFGQTVWTKLRQHPKVIKAVLGNSGDSGVASRKAVADILELQDVLVGQGYVNTAAKGQAPTMSRLWGKSIALLHVNKNITTQNPTTFGFTARLGNPVGLEYEDPEIGLRGGVVVKAGETVKELICANDLGYLISAAVA
ncbi:MAG: phage capsid protein [Ignavibacteriales bacterium]|nr:phage capsid protein [Ignavibacteriales bacterium]